MSTKGTRARRQPAGRLASAVRSNPAQLVVSILIAVLLASATWLTNMAAGYWQSAARAEIKATAATLETIRHVYHDEAPTAFDISRLLVRAGALDVAAADNPGSPAGVEAASAHKAAAEMQRVLRSTDSLVSSRYEQDDHGYALNQRLGDLLAASADLRHGPVASAMEEGDRLAQAAQVVAWAAAPCVLAFIAIRLLGHRAPRRRRRPARVDPDVGLVPQPWQEQPRLRLISAVALSAWVLLTVLTASQLTFSARSARADAVSSRYATTITSQVLASQFHSALSADAQRSGGELAISGLARQFVSVGGDPAQEALGVADEQAARIWIEVAGRMTAPPTKDDGVDELTIEMVTADADDLAALTGLQALASETAEGQGSAANLSGLALLLAALCGTAASAARLQRNTRGLVTTGSLALLTGAVVTGALAFVVA